MQEAYIYTEPIDDSIKPEAPKDIKKQILSDIFSEKDIDKRAIALLDFVETYYTHYGIKMPNDLLLEKWVKPLIYPTNKSLVYKTLVKARKGATEYHAKNVKRVYIKDNITKATLFKTIKKTFYGSRVEEMGVKGSTSNNLKEGYITEPALKLVVEKIFLREKIHQDVLNSFGNEKKIRFIGNKLKELL